MHDKQLDTNIHQTFNEEFYSYMILTHGMK